MLFDLIFFWCKRLVINRLCRFFKWILTKVLNILTFGYYIRTVIESFQFLLISWISEARLLQTDSVANTISLCSCFIILALVLVLLIFVSCLVWRTPQVENQQKSHEKLGEFFIGIKRTKISKSYALMQVSEMLKALTYF